MSALKIAVFVVALVPACWFLLAVLFSFGD
jgi:hypothetical protein